MPWGRLDDGLYDHPKLDRLGQHRLAAVGLWTLAISWCNRRLTDGIVPADRIRLLGGTRALAEHLVDAEMFEHHPDGYLVHDFLVFNESRSTVEARREADRKRKRKPDGLRPEAEPEAGRTPSDPPARAGSRPGPARPIPDQGSTEPSTGGGARAVGLVDPSDELEALPW